ncbi:MAG TPA: DUF1320 domain-containing protein [Vitreoscilla sp.]|nr:DUF1320 domain-containing protein [Vitreoscilla sp.]
MNIITRDDLLERFGEKELMELTDREAYAVINDNVLQKAIEDAEAEAGAYLQAAGLVLKAPPKALVIKTCDIARYYLYENGVTDIVEARYKQAISWFKDVVKNPQMLDANATPKASNPSRCTVIPNQPPASWADIGGKY